MNGWTEAQIVSLRTGATTGDAKIDALTRVVREAAANSGNVTDVTWQAAQQGGWSDAQLAEALICTVRRGNLDAVIAMIRRAREERKSEGKD